MAWGKLDDGLYDHPKLDELGRYKLAGVGLWALCISWSNHRLTDGVVPATRIKALGGTVELADRLVRAGLLERTPDGYTIHDFLEYNDAAVMVRARRDASAERQRRSRWARAQVDTTVTRDDMGDDIGDTNRQSPGPVRARSRPDRAEPRPVRNPPKPPSDASGRRTRANGTSPRQLSALDAELQSRDKKAHEWRRAQRQLAYFRGAITEEQRAAMNAADVPVDQIPDWKEHLVALAAHTSAVEGLDDGSL